MSVVMRYCIHEAIDPVCFLVNSPKTSSSADLNGIAKILISIDCL